MNSRKHSDAAADDGIAWRLQAWDAEGGADGACVPASATTPAPLTAQQHRLLARLGVALLHEWGHLPMPLQRAIYRRAVRGALNAEPRVLAPPMARFLHDHQERHAQARRTLQSAGNESIVTGVHRLGFESAIALHRRD